MAIRLQTRNAVAALLLGSFVVAQDDLATVLARFPDDDLPKWLAQLHGPRHAEAVPRLATLGPRAHRFLFGLAQTTHHGTHQDFAAAFGGFGPEDAWAMPALLERAGRKFLLPTMLGLLRRLGPTAAPVVPLLGPLCPGETLASELAAAASLPVPAPRAMPGLPTSVDRQWRTALLAVLTEVGEQARWWRALQATLATDDETATTAAAILVQHGLTGTPAVRERARELLLAACCHFAATAVLDLGACDTLPAAMRLDQTRRCVLGTHPSLFGNAIPFPLPGATNVAAIRQLARSTEVESRFLAALSHCLHEVLDPAGESHETELLRRLAHDSEQRVAALVAPLLARADAAVDALLHQPLTEEPTLSSRLRSFERLDGEQLARLPAARVRELLALCTSADAAPPLAPRATRPQDGELSKMLLESARPSPAAPIHGHLARAILGKLAAKAPAVILANTDVPAPERNTLLATLLACPELAPELHVWLLDELDPPPASGQNLPDVHLPIGLAPTLLARLHRGERPDHTIGLLRYTCHYLDWAEAIDGVADDLLAMAPKVSPARYPDFGRILMHGRHCRVVLERLLLDAGTPAALREALTRSLHSGLEQFPPSVPFVLALFDHADAGLAKQAVWLAGYVKDQPEPVIARLLALLPQADERGALGIAMSLGRLRATAALPLLAQRLASATDRYAARFATAMLDIDDEHAAANTVLRAAILSADAATRQASWHAISFSRSASVRFLDEAMQALTKGTDAQDGYRLVRLLETAAATQQQAAFDALRRLSRHANEQLASFAQQTLQRLAGQ